jgi:hypothetical protein
MAKRAVLLLSLLLFTLSSFPAEESFGNFEMPLQAIGSSDDLDRSQISHDVSGLLNRSVIRGKLSIKSRSVSNTTASQARLAGWINDASFSTPFYKTSVFQRTNVFRL